MTSQKSKTLRAFVTTVGLLAFASLSNGDETTFAKLGFRGLKSVSAKKAQSVRGKGFTISPITISRSVSANGVVGAVRGSSVNFNRVESFSFEKAVGVGYGTSVYAGAQRAYGIDRTVSVSYPGYSLNGYGNYGGVGYGAP